MRVCCEAEGGYGAVTGSFCPITRAAVTGVSPREVFASVLWLCWQIQIHSAQQLIIVIWCAGYVGYVTWMSMCVVAIKLIYQNHKSVLAFHFEILFQ